MIYLDVQNRIAIPQSVREITALDFTKEIRIYIKLKGDKPLMVLSNDLNLDLPCFGKPRVDGHFRIVISKELRQYLNINSSSQLLVYCLKGDLIIEKL